MAVVGPTGVHQARSQTDSQAQARPRHAAKANGGGDMRDALDDYYEMRSLEAGQDAPGKLEVGTFSVRFGATSE